MVYPPIKIFYWTKRRRLLEYTHRSYIVAGNKFNWKSFISFGLFFSFITIFLTGTILFLSPAGRVANWTNWQLFWLRKDQWQALHTVFSYTFAVLGIFHLFTSNWKVFLSYIKKKIEGKIHRKKEMLIASTLFLMIFAGTMLDLEIFSSSCRLLSCFFYFSFVRPFVQINL